MLNPAGFCCQKPKTLKTRLIWGRENFCYWKVDFLFGLNSFVQNFRLLVFLKFPPQIAEGYWNACWCIVCYKFNQLQLQIQSDSYELVLIFSIKKLYFSRLLQFYLTKHKKFVFIFFKTNPTDCMASKLISPRIWH